MKRTLCLTVISGALLVGCNLLLGTEPPVLRQQGDGGAGGVAPVITGGGAGGGDDVSFADGSGGSGSTVSTGGSVSSVCGDGSWAHWPPGGAHEYKSFTGPMMEDSITDALTGLDWQRRSVPAAASWSEAQAHCKLLKWAGKTGWRLPTRMELLSIVDYTKVKPSVDENWFPDTSPEPYWTSSTSMYVPVPLGSAFWRVGFADGATLPGMVGSDVGKIRCVRGGFPSLAGGGTNTCYRYKLTETTATDFETGLTWERAASDPLVRNDAAARCTALQSTGVPWRLPTIAELASIIDEEKVDAPRLDPIAFFTGAVEPNDWYWSSTGDAATPSAAAWCIRISTGNVSELLSPGPAHVRCVR